MNIMANKAVGQFDSFQNLQCPNLKNNIWTYKTLTFPLYVCLFVSLLIFKKKAVDVIKSLSSSGCTQPLYARLLSKSTAFL